MGKHRNGTKKMVRFGFWKKNNAEENHLLGYESLMHFIVSFQN